jgi:hypothetical protein
MHPPIISLEHVAQAVRQIESELQVAPGLILTECDAQCLLYERLRALLNDRDQQHIPTDVEHVLASPIHTEIKILDESGKLMLRPDIVVMSRGSLSLTNDDELRLIQRKGFVLFGSAVFVEVKVSKSPLGITDQLVSAIQDDCTKLDDIANRLYPENESARMLGCIVVFNRTDVRCPGFDALLRGRAARRQLS